MDTLNSIAEEFSLNYPLPDGIGKAPELMLIEILRLRTLCFFQEHKIESDAELITCYRNQAKEMRADVHEIGHGLPSEVKAHIKNLEDEIVRFRNGWETDKKVIARLRERLGEGK